VSGGQVVFINNNWSEAMNRDTKAFMRDARRALSNNRHEIAEDGAIYIPGSRAFIGGAFGHAYAPPGEGFGVKTIGKPNRVVGEGLNKILNLLGGHASSAGLFLAPFSGNVAVPGTWLGSNWAGLAQEFTAYAPATRLPWTTVPSTAQQLTNAAALAASTLTFNAGGPYIIRGAALAEASAKGATTGPLIAATRFDADLTGMMGGGRLALEYGLSAVDEDDA
jgi:hypothetical protein